MRFTSSRCLKKTLLMATSLAGLSYVDAADALTEANSTRSTSISQMLQALDIDGGTMRLTSTHGRITNIMGVDADVDLCSIQLDRLAEFRSDADSSTGRDAAVAQFITAFLCESSENALQEGLAYMYYDKAKTDIPEALVHLAMMHERGKGTYQSLPKSKEFYEEAVRLIPHQSSNNLKAKFNLVRFLAAHENDFKSMMRLANMYRGGEGVARDERMAKFWHAKALMRKEELIVSASSKEEAGQHAYELAGEYNRNAEFRRLPLYAHWMQEAAKYGAKEAWLALGSVHKRGRGVAQSYRNAFDAYTLALQDTPKYAHRNLGYMYADGCKDVAIDGQVTWELKQNKQKAFDHFMLAAGGGTSYTDLMLAAPMARYVNISLEQKKIFFDSFVNADLDVSSQDYAARDYIRGVWCEMGFIVGKDLAMAKKFYESASKAGVYAATQRLIFLNLGYDVAQQEAMPDYQRSLLAESLKKSEEAKDFVRKSRVRPEVIHSHNLSEDFESALRILEQAKQRTKDHDLRVNYDYIWSDPNLLDTVTFYGDLPNTSPEELMGLKAFLTDSMESADSAQHLTEQRAAYGTEVLYDFSNAIEKVIAHTRDKPILAKRFIRMYRGWIDGSTVHASETDLFRQVKFVEFLAQNKSRCGDGLSDFIYERYESECLRLPHMVDTIPDLLYLAFLREREEYLKLYKSSSNAEEATEAPVLLRYRVRNAFGLVDSMDRPLYPSYGLGNDELYIPANVMKRFIEGGTIRHVRNLPIPDERLVNPLSPARCIEIAREVFGSKPNLLQMEFIEKDPELNDLYREAVISMEPNEYFDFSQADNSRIFTDKLYERLLLTYGYLLSKRGV